MRGRYLCVLILFLIIARNHSAHADACAYVQHGDYINVVDLTQPLFSPSIGATGIALGPDGRTAYFIEGTDIDVIDLPTLAVTKTISIAEAISLRTPLISTDGRTLYVPAALTYDASPPGALVFIDLPAGTETARIPLPSTPNFVASSRTGDQIYLAAATVARAGYGSVTIVDAATRTVTATTALPEPPAGLAVASAVGQLYIAGSGGGDPETPSLSVVDAATGKLTDPIPAFGNPEGIVAARDGVHLYVPTDSGVAVVDAQRHRQTDFILLDYAAIGGTLAPDGTTLYVTTGVSSVVSTRPVSITAIDTTTNEITRRLSGVPVGRQIVVTEFEGSCGLPVPTATPTPPFDQPSVQLLPLPAFVSAAAPDGSLWFNYPLTAALHRFDPDTRSITTIELQPDTAVGAIAVSPRGVVWFFDTHRNAIGRVDVAAKVEEFPLPSAGANAFWLAAASDDSVWFSESDNNRIGRIDSQGAVSEFVLPTSGSRPEQIVASNDGTAWVGENGAHQIGRITPSGALTEFVLPNMIGYIVLTTGPDGNVWAAGNGTPALFRITPAGQLTAVLLTDESDTGGDSTIAGVGGIASGPDGNLWALVLPTNGSPQALARITIDGQTRQFGPILADRIFSAPGGTLFITFDNKVAKLDLYDPNAPSPTPTPSATNTATPTVTPTSDGGVCAGDCNIDGEISISELLLLVNVSLGNTPLAACLPGDANADGAIAINEIIAAVNAALEGCDPMQNAPLAYLARGQAGLSIIDTATANVVHVLSTTALDIAVTPDGHSAYVSAITPLNETITGIDLLSGRPRATIEEPPTLVSMISLIAAPDGQRVYASSNIGLQVIDTVSDDVITTDANAGAFAISPDSKLVFSPGEANSLIARDVSTLAVVTQIPVSGGADPICAAAVSADGKTVYVRTRGWFGNVYAVDLQMNRVSWSVSAPDGECEIAVTPDGTMVFAADDFGTTVVDTSTHQVVGHVGVGGPLAITPDGRWLYVVQNTGVAVLDPSTMRLATLIPIEGTRAIAIAPRP